MSVNIIPPQYSPVFSTMRDGSVVMTKPWVLFFNQLNIIAQQALTAVTTAATTHFASFDSTGRIEDSGYSPASFLTSPHITSPTLSAPTIQNGASNGLVITGGSLNSCPVGSSSPSTGRFTTITAGTGVSAPYHDSGTSSALLLRTNNGTVQAQIAHVHAASNYVQISGASAGKSVAIAALGTDTDIDLTLTPKGAGKVRIPTVANGLIATALTARGPTGANTTVQEWFAIKNASGTVRYVPGF